MLLFIVFWQCCTGKYTTHKIRTKLHPGPEWRISISSLVRILMTLFPAFAWLFVQTVGEKRRSTDLSEKIKLHGGLKLRILFLVLKTIFYHSKIKFTSSCRCVISSIRLMRESLLPFFLLFRSPEGITRFLIRKQGTQYSMGGRIFDR